MSYFIFDRDIKNVVPPSRFKQARTGNDSDTYEPGDIIEAWDHVFRWDEACIPNSTMQEWRFLGDKLADDALPIILGPAGDAGGSDLLLRLQAAAASPSAGVEVQGLWKQLLTIDETPFHYDRAQIARGQAVFYRYGSQILASLLQFSLSAGFSSPLIARVSNLTSYLVPPMSSTPEGEAPRITKSSNDRTFQRLMETTQFVVDCMSGDAMEVQHEGWRAAVRVRLLHATVRRRLLLKVRSAMQHMPNPPYIEERDGIPISQEDYVATLASFSGAPLLSVMKLGVRPTLQECEDYTALWKVIGYYIGIDETILHQHMSSWHQCTRLAASAIVSVFAGESDPPPPTQFPFDQALVPKQDQVIRVQQTTVKADPWTSPATLAVLFSVCNRWPVQFFNLVNQSAAARAFVGPSLSDWLSIPKTNFSERMKLHVGFAFLNASVGLRAALPTRLGCSMESGNAEERVLGHLS